MPDWANQVSQASQNHGTELSCSTGHVLCHGRKTRGLKMRQLQPMTYESSLQRFAIVMVAGLILLRLAVVKC